MNFNTLTSGLVTSKYGLRPALLCATRRDLAKHSVIRVLTDSGSGWIGISFGKVITGARYQEGSNTLNGVEALAQLLQAENGHFDLIQLSSRLIGDELAQDVGVSIDQLLDELQLQSTDAVHQIISRCKKDWESLYLLEGMTGDELPADGNSHASQINAEADASEQGDEEYDDEDDLNEWDVTFDDDDLLIHNISKTQGNFSPPPAEPNFVHVSGTQEYEPPYDAYQQYDPYSQAQVPDELVRSLRDSDKQRSEIRDTSAIVISKEQLQAEALPGVEAIAKNDEAFASNSSREESSTQPADILAGKDSSDEGKASSQAPGPTPTPLYLQGRTQDKKLPASPSDTRKMLRKTGSLNTPRVTRSEIKNPELSSLRDEMQFELSEFVQAKLNTNQNLFTENLEIQDLSNYQSSLVLKDLEDALEQAKQSDNLTDTGSFDRIPDRKRRMRKERVQSELDESRRELAILAATAPDLSVQTSEAKSGLADKFAPQLETTQARRKTTSINYSELANSASSKPIPKDEIPAATREIFVEQVRKNTEVDPMAFINQENKKDNAELETKFLKQKQFRQAIIIGSSTCLIAVSLMLLIGNLAKQATLVKASEKIASGDLEGARKEYERIIKEQPSNWQAYMGHALSMPGQPEKRILDYEKVLSIKPDEMNAAMGIAKAELDLKQFDKANRAADRASKIDENNPDPHKLKAQSLMKLGRFTEATDELKRALGLEKGKTDEISYLLAQCYKSLQQPKEQLSYLDKAIEVAPKTALYLRERAIMRFQNRDFKGARTDVERGLLVNPGQGELHFMLAQLLLRENKSDDALAEMTKAINLGYATADSYGQRGLLYASKRMTGEAKVDLEEACKAKPNDKTYHRALLQVDGAIAAAKARAGTRRIDNASDDSIDLGSIKGDLVQAGYGLMRQGKYNSAATVLAAAVRQNPNDPRSRSLLAHAFYLSGDYVNASTEFGNVYKLQGLSPEDHLLYGRSLSKANRLEQAIDVLSNLVDQQPEYNKARVELIKAYSLSGFTDHAREQCQLGMKHAKTQPEYNQFKSLMP